MFSDKYCLEIKAMSTSKGSIQILQNKIVIETINKFSNYSHSTCVHQFDAQNDIFELRSRGRGKVSKLHYVFIFEIFNIILIFNSY